MSKFVIRRVATGIKFDLKAANGEIIATSEVYATAAACRKGIESVKKAAGAPLLDLTDAETTAPNPKFELYRDKAGAYRFRLRSRNSKIIAFSEPYSTKAACRAGIESVRSHAPTAETEES